jgi:hypothetical protein
VLIALAVLALSAVAPAAPAARAADASGPVEAEGRSSGQCLSGRFCVWSGTGFSGAFWSTGALGVSDSAVVTARSVWNRTAQDVLVYAGAGAGGSSTCWDAGAQSASTATPSGSIRTMGPTTC